MLLLLRNLYIFNSTNIFYQINNGGMINLKIIVSSGLGQPLQNSHFTATNLTENLV